MTKREEQIHELLLKGYSYTAIAPLFGLTRERIRQIAKENGWIFFNPAKKLWEELGARRDYIYRHLRDGKIKGHKVGHKWIVDEIPQIHSDCVICGDKLPLRRTRFCPKHDLNEISRWKYNNVPEYKERIRRTCRKWWLKKKGRLDG